MDFYNEIAISIKRYRSLFMFLINLGLGYIEYLMITYFLKVFNLYLKKNHAEELTFVIALGIIVLIVLITIVFYQWAVTLVLIFRGTIRSKEETGLRWIFENSFIIGTSCFFISFLIMEICIFLFFLFNETLNIFWEVPFGLYAIFLLYGVIKGLQTEFKALKYKDNI